MWESNEHTYQTFAERFPVKLQDWWVSGMTQGFIYLLFATGFRIDEGEQSPAVDFDDYCPILKSQYFDFKYLNQMFYSKYRNRLFNGADSTSLHEWYKGGQWNSISGISKEFYRIELLGLLTMYGTKWQKLAEGLGLYKTIANDWKYKPLDNYSMKEEFDGQRRNTGTQADAHTGTVGDSGTVSESASDTLQHGHVSTIAHGKKITIKDDDVSGEETNTGYGFDSGSSGVPVGKKNASSSHDSENTESGSTTDTNSGTDINSKQSLVTNANTRTFNNTDTRTDNLTEVVDNELKRSGNIGVTTSQQMAESEIQLRMFLVYDEMLKDILSVYSMPIF